jgi:hypothetical protein
MTQRELLKELNNGAVILVEYINDPPSQVRVVHRLSTTNQCIRASVIQRMIDEKLIRPNEDGLPGMGVTQSYRLWRASEGGA